MEQEDGWPREEEEEAEAGSAEEEEGGAAGCAVLCRDGVVGLMVAGPLRPLRLRPPSPAPRYQPPIPLLVPQGSTALPPTKRLSFQPSLDPPPSPSLPLLSTLQPRMPALDPPPPRHPLRPPHQHPPRRVRLRRKPAASHPASRPASHRPSATSPLLPPLPRIFRERTNASRCS